MPEVPLLRPWVRRLVECLLVLALPGIATGLSFVSAWLDSPGTGLAALLVLACLILALLGRGIIERSRLKPRANHACARCHGKISSFPLRHEKFIHDSPDRLRKCRPPLIVLLKSSVAGATPSIHRWEEFLQNLQIAGFVGCQVRENLVTRF